MKAVYEFSDLKHWNEVTADHEQRPLLAVIGDPVAHSKSPQMHQPALDACEIDGAYVRLHLRPEEIDAALALLPGLGFRGINVTIPHKLAALEAATRPDPLALKMQAANTLLFRDGEIFAWNSDGPGFRDAVREEFGRELKDLRVAIIGAGGGAGRGVSVQCAAEGCRRLVLVNRTVAKVDALAKELQSLLSSERLSTCLWEKEALRAELGQVDLIVNATSLGMKPDDAEVVPAELLQSQHLVYDMVYSGGGTRLIEAAKGAGAGSANGLAMLLHQGAISFEHWFDRTAPLEEMRQGLLQA